MSRLPAPAHLNQLDFIRAFASLWVAIYHLSGKKYIIGTYGYLGVPMFFVLSGFVICWSLPENYSLKNLSTFLSKRLVRIEPPYLLSIMLLLLINFAIAVSKGIPYQVDVKNVLLHLAYLNNFTGNPYLNPVYWTLGIEFQFYLLIGVFFPLMVRNRFSSLLMLVIFSFTSVWMSAIDDSYSVIFRVSTLFCLGMSGYLFKKGKISGLHLLVLTVFNVATCYFTQGLPATLAGLATLLLILYFNYSNSAIRFFARISFSLYLVHDIIGSKWVIFAGSLFAQKSIMTKVFAFSSGLAISIFSAYLFYLLIEKPCLKWSKKIAYSIHGHAKVSIDSAVSK